MKNSDAQDAERYRWLRWRLRSVKWSDTPFDELRTEDCKYIWDDELDRAIDKAMKE